MGTICVKAEQRIWNQIIILVDGSSGIDSLYSGRSMKHDVKRVYPGRFITYFVKFALRLVGEIHGVREAIASTSTDTKANARRSIMEEETQKSEYVIGGKQIMRRMIATSSANLRCCLGLTEKFNTSSSSGRLQGMININYGQLNSY